MEQRLMPLQINGAGLRAQAQAKMQEHKEDSPTAKPARNPTRRKRSVMRKVLNSTPTA